MFTKNDLLQFRSKGISTDAINRQIEYFISGFPYTNLVKAATVEDGILQLNENQTKGFIKKFQEDSTLSKIKFVPASGAATRMFKFLFEFVKSNEITEDIENFYANLSKFAFFNDLKSAVKRNGLEIEKLISEKKIAEIITILLYENGMNYGNLPKALIPFHCHNNQPVTAAEEHIIESSEYVKANNNADMHFTVSEEHIAAFNKLLDFKLSDYEKEFGIHFHIEFSVQNEKTDTIAVDPENKPFRANDGSILFRPGGHGTLLENLNRMNEEIIFIKNIDNVCADKFKETTYQWKKVLGGILIETQENVHKILTKIEKGETGPAELAKMEEFCKKKLNISLPAKKAKWGNKEKTAFLQSKLNRPIRVCGMVKNEGEPGGGPFWIKNKKNELSLQIVESSQVDPNDPVQKSIFNSSTHFNPVDIVCTIKDYKGNKFDLARFFGNKTGFISEKSVDGKPLKALELPGLWNGSMAEWITVFVEVPNETFNPVKTVNDLLKVRHQG